MCTELQHADDQEAGWVLGLCKDYIEHIAEDFGFPRIEPSGVAELDPKRFFGGPIERTLAAFGASVVIVEQGYFDLDYRSEFTIVNETSFAPEDPLAHRLHFFSGAWPEPHTRLRDAVLKLKDGYLGYIIIRPTQPPTVGRSVIRPTPITSPPLDSGTTLARHVRTAMTEYVDLFSISLSAVGTPFMEQDGRLLRCAHVTAWMAHYTAVLRGLVARRPSAAFARIEDLRSYGRSYPSTGLSLSSQTAIMSRLDLPPELVRGSELIASIDPAWYRRQDSPKKAGRARDDHLVTVAENLTSTVCRYLNSGIPVILDRSDEYHSQLIVGYVRQEDLEAGSRVKLRPAQSDVVAFIVQDDQEGPFQFLMVEELLASVRTVKKVRATHDGFLKVPFSLVVPLPRGLWLSGKAAEMAGGEVFRTAASRRLPGDHPFRAAVEGRGASPGFGIRTYALSSSDFKHDFIRRLDHPEAAHVVSTVRLPKHVWVVEAIDRAKRSRQEPAVVGTVVLDGTAVSEEGTYRPPDPLLIQLPGTISAVPEDSQETYANDSWSDGPADAYETGRWNNPGADFMSPTRVASRQKGAAVQ